MARYRYPKNPLAYLSRLMPRGFNTYFTRRGIGCLIRCGFCGKTPPDECVYSAQKWRWLAGHEAVAHHGREKPAAATQIGAAHGVERSQDSKSNSRYAVQ